MREKVGLAGDDLRLGYRASPDTLGVNAGAYLAVVVVAAFGGSLPVLPAGGVAFLGGLAAAVLVLALSAGGSSGPTRLILAGSAVAMALAGVTTLLLLLYREETVGTFAWGAGTLVQTDLKAVTQMTPVDAVGIIGSMLLAALAIAGTTVQAVCRNPLAEPGILGITGGAGLGAVITLVLLPSASIWLLSGVAAVAALVTFALVYLVSWRGGLSSDRLVLIGVGVSSGATAIITLLIVATDPWNLSMAMTWLSGSTYGRTLPQVAPVAIALLIFTPIIVQARRELDLLALDDDVPRILGVRLERTRLTALLCAALLTAAAVSAIGVVGFVGLVAPHAARALVGGRHTRILPVAALLGAILVSVADSLGHTLLAPAQIPAGLLTALIGAPYFAYLLWRTRVPNR